MDPISQFNIKPIIPIHLFGIDASFTNASLLMLIAVALVCLLMLYGTSRRAIVPNRLQSAAEVAYEFMASTVKMTNGKDGMKFFPLIFTLFTFILVSNFIRLVPSSFAVTSQIFVTATMAISIILLVVAVGIFRHGLHFFKVFVPSGVTPILLPFIVLVEIVSFLTRPVSLSVRLFANMLAGDIVLKVMAGFTAALVGAGLYAVIAPLPFVGYLVMLAFEVLQAVLQAYVFAILTCVYLNDAIHPGH
jgi:F-type H+-transporting ATPase subunit a